MQQRKKIYERALGRIRKDTFICIAFSHIFINDSKPSHAIIKQLHEFMLFKPDRLTTFDGWFESKLEREICLDFCILFCNEKMFDNA